MPGCATITPICLCAGAGLGFGQRAIADATPGITVLPLPDSVPLPVWLAKALTPLLS